MGKSRHPKPYLNEKHLANPQSSGLTPEQIAVADRSSTDRVKAKKAVRKRTKIDHIFTCCDRSINDVPNVILEWFQIFHCWDFLQAKSTRGKPDWITISKYPITPENLYAKWASTDELIGVRFKNGKQGTTSYLMIDIDAGSSYHPYKDPQSLNELLEIMEDIGLCRYIAIRSSPSNGLHLYFPMPKPLPCYRLAVAVKSAVEKAGFEVKPGQLEIFPNVKTPRSNYNGHRLPLQEGSYVLDQSFQPGHNSLHQLIDVWHLAASKQDTDLLSQIVASSQSFQQTKSKDCEEWRKRLETTLNKGWTGNGQTNGIINTACVYARVFLEKNWNEVEQWVLHTTVSLPGYQKFCRHQHHIKRRVRDWVKTNRRTNRYRPYSNTPKQPRVRLAPPNEVRSADALKRIQDAIAHIIKEMGELPKLVRDRQKLICKVANCSASTLRKYLELWHPNHCNQRCVTVEPANALGYLARSLKTVEQNENQSDDQLGYVTVESVGISSIAGHNADVLETAENLSNWSVTYPTLLSVEGQLDRSLRDQTNSLPFSSNIPRTANRELQNTSYGTAKSNIQNRVAEVSDFHSAIAVHSVVRRKSDGALFRIKQINSNGTVWAKWLNQYVPLVDIVLPVSEVEPVLTEKIG